VSVFIDMVLCADRGDYLINKTTRCTQYVTGVMRFLHERLDVYLLRVNECGCCKIRGDYPINLKRLDVLSTSLGS
jgi:hypothetical protein